MKTTTSIRASKAKATADQSPQRRPLRRAAAPSGAPPEATVAAVITAATVAHPRALPNSVAVLKAPEARPCWSSPTPPVAATVRGRSR